MNRLHHILILFFALIALSSCNGKKGKLTPFEASGRPLQLVAVMPDQYDTPEMREALGQAFGGPTGLLPQDEPDCDLIFATHSSFTKLFKIFRNILYVDINPERYTRTGIHLSKDEYAAGQLITTIKAPTVEEMYQLLKKERPRLTSIYYKEELYRRWRVIARTYSSQMAQLITDSIGGITMNPLVEIKQTNAKQGFVWGTTLAPTGRIDIVVYDFPYTDPNTFTVDYLTHKRDSVLSIHIPGEYPGSYMTTEKRLPPLFKAFSLNGAYRAEMRGLWQMEGDMMGGPFVMHAVVDESRQRVVVAETFVFAPGKEKRNLVLLGEATLYTLRPAESEFTPEAIKIDQ